MSTDTSRFAFTELRTLLRREILRFVRRPKNTFLPPFITNTLYFAVFGVILGGRIGEMQGYPYLQFVLPGLVVLGSISNAFTNAGFTIFHARWNNYIHDVLTAPITHTQQVLAYVTASMIRGLLVGVLITAVGLFFTPIPVANPAYLVVVMLAITALFAGFGAIGGLWAQDFDYLTVLNQFIIRPLVFFGGVFYSLDALPGIWRAVSFVNPMVYMVNGVRYGFLGFSEINPWLALGVLVGASIVVVLFDIYLFARGYGLTD